MMLWKDGRRVVPEGGVVKTSTSTMSCRLVLLLVMGVSAVILLLLPPVVVRVTCFGSSTSSSFGTTNASWPLRRSLHKNDTTDTATAKEVDYKSTKNASATRTTPPAARMENATTSISTSSSSTPTSKNTTLRSPPEQQRPARSKQEKHDCTSDACLERKHKMAVWEKENNQKMEDQFRQNLARGFLPKQSWRMQYIVDQQEPEVDLMVHCDWNTTSACPIKGDLSGMNETHLFLGYSSSSRQETFEKNDNCHCWYYNRTRFRYEYCDHSIPTYYALYFEKQRNKTATGIGGATTPTEEEIKILPEEIPLPSVCTQARSLNRTYIKSGGIVGQDCTSYSIVEEYSCGADFLDETKNEDRLEALWASLSGFCLSRRPPYLPCWDD